MTQFTNSAENAEEKKAGKYKSLGKLFWILIPFLFIFSGCAQNQPRSGIDFLESKIETLEKRVIDMEKRSDLIQTNKEKQLSDLKATVNKKMANLKRSQQFFLKELDGLKNDIQLITNENENTLRKIKNNNVAYKNLRKKLGDLIISIDELKAFFSANTNVSAIPEVDKTKPDDPTKIFKAAYELYKAKQLKKSQDLFKKYRQLAPNTNLTDDSVYFVAYIYFLEKKYDEAVLHFFELVNQFSKSNWYYDAKWWLAISLERTGDISGAIDIYHELKKLKSDHLYHHRATTRLEELQQS